jgi:hypothetical protein
LAAVLRKEKDEDLEIRARNALGSIKTKYGFSEGQTKGEWYSCSIRSPSYQEQGADYVDISIIAQQHTALEISDRWGELWKENVEATHKKRGDLVFTYFITYEWHIEQNQARCRIIEQLQREGLIDFDSLFPSGGNHATVRRDVEAFDRFLYLEWERSLVLKDTDEEGRKREYRKFLGDRERNWGRQYLEWLGHGKDENQVKVDM